MAGKRKEGIRFHRTGFFDIGIKGSQKVIKDKRLLIQVFFPPLKYGLPLLFAAAILVPDTVPEYLSAAAAGFVGSILITRLMRWQWVNSVLRIAFYLIVPMVLTLGRIEPAIWVTQGMLDLYDYAYGALALFTVLTLKFTRRKRGFKATPMDFLVLLIALIVLTLSASFLGGSQMGYVAVKLIVLYFGLEVLIGELRGELRKIAIGMLTALVLLAVRGVSG